MWEVFKSLAGVQVAAAAQSPIPVGVATLGLLARGERTRIACANLTVRECGVRIVTPGREDVLLPLKPCGVEFRDLPGPREK